MRRAAAGSAPEADGGAAVFFGAGFAFVTAFTYSPLEIRETLLHGVNAPMLVDNVPVGAGDHRQDSLLARLRHDVPPTT